MDAALLLNYLTGFPKQMILALVIFFLPMRKKERWYLYLPVLAALLGGCVSVGYLAWPILYPTVPGEVFFGLHYLLVLGSLSLSLRLMCGASWQECFYAVICAYMAEHLLYCVDTLTAYLMRNAAWWNADAFHYVFLAIQYSAVYFLFARKVCVDGRYPASLARTAWLLLIEFVLMYAISIDTIHMDLAWLHAVYAMICICFILISESQWALQIQAQEELRAKEALWTLNKAQYEMTQENIAIINRKCHDLRHQVMALRAVGSDREREAAIDSMEQAVQIYDTAYNTGSKTLDTVLMQKGLVCNQNHIALSVIADGQLLSFVEPVDLYTMLANILDNAIEANLKIPEEAQRAIHLSVHEKKGLVILQEENPFAVPVQLQNGLPVTTKADKTIHGFGTRSIAYTAEKYGGVLRVTTDGGMFVLRAIFPSMGNEITNQGENLHN